MVKKNYIFNKHTDWPTEIKIASNGNGYLSTAMYNCEYGLATDLQRNVTSSKQKEFHYTNDFGIAGLRSKYMCTMQE